MKGKINRRIWVVFMAGALMMVSITAGIAKSDNPSQENYLEEAKRLLEEWKERKEKGVNGTEIREIIPKMEFYREKLRREIDEKINEGRTEELRMKEIALAEGILQSEIDYLKFLLEEGKKTREEWKHAEEKLEQMEEVKDKNPEKICEILDMEGKQKEIFLEAWENMQGEKVNTFSSYELYPTNGWKKEKKYHVPLWWDVDAEADYDVASKEGFSRATAHFGGKASGISSLYWETIWPGLPFQWRVEYEGEFDGWLIFIGGGQAAHVDIKGYAHDTWNDVYYETEIYFYPFSPIGSGSKHLTGEFSDYDNELTFNVGQYRMENWRIGVKLEAHANHWSIWPIDELVESNFYNTPWTLDKMILHM